MDIADAFSAEAIDEAGATLDDATETELRRIARVLADDQQMELTELEEGIACMFFIAGRTYQANEGLISITMTPRQHDRYLRFLDDTIEEMSSP